MEATSISPRVTDTTTITASSPEATEAVGARLAACLQGGDVVLLSGELGAGKTVFVRGLIRGLGSDAHVSSPTFVLIHEYAGPCPVAHIDLYRLGGAGDAEEIGLRDYLEGQFITVVEWPERAQGFNWGTNVWRLRISVTGESSRSIAVTAPEGRALP